MAHGDIPEPAFARFLSSRMWKSIHTLNVIKSRHEEFKRRIKRRIKTQTALLWAVWRDNLNEKPYCRT
jgi:transposase-like protein